MSPLVRPFMDALEVYYREKGEEPKNIQGLIEDLMYQRMIRIESLAYMRGRSLSNCILIVDEIQNASPKQLRGIVSRMGKNSKCIRTLKQTMCNLFRFNPYKNLCVA